MSKRMNLPKPNNALLMGLFMMIIKVSFSLSRILMYNDVIDNVLSFGAVALLVLYIMNKRYGVKKMLIYAFATVLSLYSVMITKQSILLITTIAVLAIADEKFDKIIDFIYRWELFFFIVHIIISIFYKILLDGSITQVIDGKTRYNFGFSHPNTFSVYLFNLIIMWIWLNYNKLNYKSVFKIFLIGSLAYLFSKTRTGYVDIILICSILLICIKKKSGKLFSLIAMGIVPVFSLGIFFMISHYVNDIGWVLKINDLLSSRIKLGAYAYSKCGLSFWGQNIERMKVTWNNYWMLNNFTFDCTYSSLMVMQGCIWLVIVSIAFFLLAMKKIDRINIAIIAWSLYAVTEVHGLNGFLCFPILLLAMLISNKKEKIDEEI
jgi:hypothetical protein